MLASVPSCLSVVLVAKPAVDQTFEVNHLLTNNVGGKCNNESTDFAR